MVDKGPQGGFFQLKQPCLSRFRVAFHETLSLHGAERDVMKNTNSNFDGRTSVFQAFVKYDYHFPVK